MKRFLCVLRASAFPISSTHGVVGLLLQQTGDLSHSLCVCSKIRMADTRGGAKINSLLIRVDQKFDIINESKNKTRELIVQVFSFSVTSVASEQCSAITALIRSIGVTSSLVADNMIAGIFLSSSLACEQTQLGLLGHAANLPSAAPMFSGTRPEKLNMYSPPTATKLNMINLRSIQFAIRLLPLATLADCCLLYTSPSPRD